MSSITPSGPIPTDAAMKVRRQTNFDFESCTYLYAFRYGRMVGHNDRELAQELRTGSSHKASSAALPSTLKTEEQNRSKASETTFELVKVGHSKSWKEVMKRLYTHINIAEKWFGFQPKVPCSGLFTGEVPVHGKTKAKNDTFAAYGPDDVRRMVKRVVDDALVFSSDNSAESGPSASGCNCLGEQLLEPTTYFRKEDDDGSIHLSFNDLIFLVPISAQHEQCIELIENMLRIVLGARPVTAILKQAVVHEATRVNPQLKNACELSYSELVVSDHHVVQRIRQYYATVEDICAEDLFLHFGYDRLEFTNLLSHGPESWFTFKWMDDQSKTRELKFPCYAPIERHETSSNFHS